MVCSGDPGILAMAGLLYELRAREPRFGDIPEYRVLPGDHRGDYRGGLAWRAAPERLLSGKPVRSAGPGGRGAPQRAFGQPNPCCRWRCTTPPGANGGLCWTKRLLFSGNIGGRDVLCAYVKNAGREQETKWVGKLSEFPAAEVDMSTLIIIGGPRTRLDSGVLYEPRGYVEKYMGGGGNGNRRNGDSAFRKRRAVPSRALLRLRFPQGLFPA